MPARLARSATLHSVLAAVARAALACSEGPPAAPLTLPSDALRSVPAEDWQRLASTRILFAHQSVGADILRDVAEVARAVPSLRLNIVVVASARGPEDACLLHFFAGRNAEPLSKVEASVRFVDRASDAPPDIAFLKFCYLDVNARTDVHAVFESYRDAVAGLRSRHPRTTFVHLTMPLWIVRTGWRVVVKDLIGRPIGGNGDNARRNEFNELLRTEFVGKRPVFDLAEIESTRLDGSRVTFTRDGRLHQALAPEYTSDGGHLNELGRRLVAEKLLRFLAATARDREAARGLTR